MAAAGLGLVACLFLALSCAPAFAQSDGDRCNPAPAGDDLPPGAVGVRENLPNNLGDRHLELLFNVTHNYPAQPENATRLHFELRDVCANTDGKFATYIITITDAIQGELAKPILSEAFHTESGVLNLDIINDETTAIQGTREQLLNSYLAEPPGYAVTIRAPIRPDGSYTMSIMLLTIDNIRNLFASGSEPVATLSWDQQDRSVKIPFSPKPQAPQPALPYEPLTGLKTDKQHYESGDMVTVTANIGQNTARALKEKSDISGGLRIGVYGLNLQQEFVLMDNISNITDAGDISYSFQMKGIGTMQDGQFTLQIWSPSGGTASAAYNFTYSRERAIASNPMTVDWNDGTAKSMMVDAFDMKYGENPFDTSKQVFERTFSREMRYKVVPEGAATITSMTASHLKPSGGEFILGASLDVRLDAIRNGTLIIDVPIDVVEPNQIKMRGPDARTGGPFEISSNIGAPTTRLLYYDEVQHVVAIDFTPEYKSLLLSGKTAEPLTDEVLNAYVVPEFHPALVMAAVLALTVGYAAFKRSWN